MKRYIPRLNEFYLNKSLNENFFSNLWSNVKGALKKVGEWFQGKGSTYLNILIAQNKGMTDSRITFYPSPGDIDTLEENGVSLASLYPVNESINSWIFEAASATKLTSNDPSIPNVGTQELIEEIKFSVYDKKTRLMIWGAPGIGKTSIVGQICEETKGRLADIQVANMNPEDFFLPSIKEGGKQSTRILLDELACMYHKDNVSGDDEVNGENGGILFLDELSRASQPVQNICLKLVLERKLGDYRLGSKWTVIAAGNREVDDNTDFNWGTALSDRFKHVNYVPSAEEWGKWAMAYTEDGEKVLDLTVVGFVQFDTEMFHAMDISGDTKVWPTPRSWANVARELYIRSKRLGRPLTDEESKRIAESTVGVSAASRFLNYLRIVNSLDFNELKLVYTNPEKAPIPEKDPKTKEWNHQVAAATFRAIAYLNRDRKPTVKELENIVKYAIRLNDSRWAIVMISSYNQVIKEFFADDSALAAAWVKLISEELVKKYPGIISDKYTKMYNSHKKEAQASGKDAGVYTKDVDDMLDGASKSFVVNA